jgi:hypothetical protein
MQVGDVVPQSVVRVDRPNIKATFKPGTGRVAMLLILGDADKKDPDSFDSVKALNDLGWFGGHKYNAMKELLQELHNEPSCCDLSGFQTRLDEVMTLVNSPV